MRTDDGFSMVEVLVAATVLVIGVAGTLGLIMGADNATTATSRTEGGTNLAREVIERVRQLPVSQVNATSIAGAVQGLPGLSPDPGNPGTWTVKRRGTSYTLDVTACAVDDAKDGSGQHPAGTFCTTGGGATGSNDSQPQDFMRVTADVTWRGKTGQTRRVRQVQLISGRGADGPGVSALVTTSPSFPHPNAPIVSTAAATTVSFKATVAATATKVHVLIHGSPPGPPPTGPTAATAAPTTVSFKAPVSTTATKVNVLINGSPPDPSYGPATATASGNGTDWTFTLNVAAMPDQSYQVSVQAEDALGVKGQPFFIPLLLNRAAPPAPDGVVGALNTVYISHVLTPVAEIAWEGEDNVLGYHVYRPDGTQACEIILADDPKWPTSCKDDTPQDGFYEVAAIYQDAS